HCVPGEERLDVVQTDPRDRDVDLQAGEGTGQPLPGNLHLGTTQVLGTVEWLPVEAGGIDHLPLHQGEAPDTCPGPPPAGRSAEPPHPDDPRRPENPAARVRHMRPALLPLLLLAAAGCRPSGSPQGNAPPPPETSNAAARPTPAAERSTPPTP